VTQHLPTDALRALLATKGIVGPHEVVEAIVASAHGMERATLLLRVLPSEDWSTGLTARESANASHLLGVLLDGELWLRHQLAERLEIHDRELRAAVEVLRHAGFPILARSERPGGYRLTDDPDEIEDYIERELTPRAMRMHELEGVLHRSAQRCRAARDEGAMQPAQGRFLWEGAA
jgi:biotin operon repressor